MDRVEVADTATFDRLAVHAMAEGAPINPANGLPLPERLSDAVAAVAAGCRELPALPASLLTHIAGHCVREMAAVLRQPRRKIERRHTLLPIHHVRRVDAHGMLWLARQPGSSIRDKLAQSQRMLAQVSQHSLDLRENRVVRDVAERVAPLIRPVLARLSADTSRLSSTERERLEQLQEFARLATEGLRASGFETVRRERVTAPNNVLMADPNYRPIWQAHLWLRSYGNDIRRVETERTERCAAIVFALLLADLHGCAGVGLQDRMVRRETGLAGTAFGLRCVDGLHYAQGETQPEELHYADREARTDGEARANDLRYAAWKTPADASRGDDGETQVEAWRARETEFDWLRLTLSGGSIRVEKWILAGQPVARPRFTEHWDIRLARGEATVGNADGLLGRIAFVMDGAGLHKLAQALADWLLPELRRDDDGSPFRQLEARQVALDPAAALPRLVIDGTRQPARVLAAIGVHEARLWVGAKPGDAAPLDVPTWFSGPACLAEIQRKQEETAATANALGRILRQLWAAHVAPGPAVELALAVPSLLPEPARNTLRRAVGPGFAKVWLIDRAPAAALGWQEHADFRHARVRPGDHLLVVDSEAGGLYLSWLRAEPADQIGQPGQALAAGHPGQAPAAGQPGPAPPVQAERARPAEQAGLARQAGPARQAGNAGQTAKIVWMRDLSATALPFAPALTGSAWLADYLDRFVATLLQAPTVSQATPEALEALEALPERLLRNGDAERLLAGAPLPIVLPASPAADGPAVARFELREPLASEASRAWCDAYRAWLEANAMRIRAALPVLAQGARWHVLHVGRPLDRPDVSVQVRLAWDRLVATRYLRLTHYLADPAGLVTSGAAAFLALRPASTWFDRLPELFLEIEGQGGVQLRQILRGERVAPGETVRIRSPAPGQPGYEPLSAPVGEVQPLLPVIDARRAVAFNARLRSARFPLQRPAAIGLDVSYTHGESEIRLTVRSEAPDQPFRDIEASLVGIVDRVPVWPEPNPQAMLQRRLERLRTVLAGHPREADRLALGAVPSAGTVQATAQTAWLPWLEERAADVPPSRDSRDRVELGRQLLLCLEAAPLPATPALIGTLVRYVPPNPRPGEVVALGRAARWLGLCLRDDSALQQQEALPQLIQAFAVMGGYAVQQRNGRPLIRLTQLSPVLEALRQAFYTRPGFLLRLDAAAIGSLTRSALLLLEDEEVWRLQDISDETIEPQRRRSEFEARFLTLSRTCGMLVTLLQLRGMAGVAPEARALVEAGSVRTHAMARALRQLDFSFHAAAPADWKPMVSDLRLEQERSSGRMYPVTFAAYALLAGYDPGQLLQGDAAAETDVE